jgi:sensor c-di-GMP phosphodiesterase-like protein
MASFAVAITAGAHAEFTDWLYCLAGDGQSHEFLREINLGLAAREFELFCQPLLEANNKCVGVEILLRWNNPVRAGYPRRSLFPSPKSTI